jgi:hypothetical protein
MSLEELRHWMESLPERERAIAEGVVERVSAAIGGINASYIDPQEVATRIVQKIVADKLRMSVYERTCLSHWFPLIERAGLPVPRTTIIHTDCDLAWLLDGQKPEGFDAFLESIKATCRRHGVPCFLRTGQGSGKHSWDQCCYVSDVDRVGNNVVCLVEWSHGVDIMGLPHDVWAVRDLIPTSPLFRCTRFGNFPVTREFRFFMDGDVHVQPYWPPEAIEQGAPNVDDWRERLETASELSGSELEYLSGLARRAVQAVGGYWSIDFLQDASGEWWLCDMAVGERSFRWGPA